MIIDRDLVRCHIGLGKVEGLFRIALRLGGDSHIAVCRGRGAVDVGVRVVADIIEGQGNA